MKNKELARLLQHPSLKMEGFVLKGALLFKPPLNHLLRGFYFDSSAFSRSTFYVTVFVMPLCVPTKHLHFTFGDRIRGRWNGEMPDLADKLGVAMKGAVAAFLSNVESLTGFVSYASGLASTPRTLEGIGYALARQGNVTGAIEVFDKLLRASESIQTNTVVPWVGELTDRVGHLKHMLSENPDKALSELVASEKETLHNFRLDEFLEV